MNIELINNQKELVLYNGQNNIDGDYAVICPREHLNDLKTKLYKIYKTYFFGPRKRIPWMDIPGNIVLPKYIKTTQTFKIDGTLYFSIGFKNESKYDDEYNYVTVVRLLTEAGILTVCNKTELKHLLNLINELQKS